MGYRSDVVLIFYALKKEDWPVLQFWLKANMPDPESGWRQDYPASATAEYRWESVKWYDDYSEVRAVTEAMRGFCDTFDGNESKFAYEFVRVDEGYDDVETDASDGHECRLSVQRTIHIDA